MSLGCLTGTPSIGGVKVAHIYPNENTDPDPLKKFIRLHHRYNTISFQMQKDEDDPEGCGVESLIAAAMQIIIFRPSRRKPNPEYDRVLMHLERAMIDLKARKKNMECEENYV